MLSKTKNLTPRLVVIKINSLQDNNTNTTKINRQTYMLKRIVLKKLVF